MNESPLVLVIAVALSFSLILYLVKKRVNMGLATMAGGLLLALLAGLPPGRIVKVYFFALIDKGTIELVVDVFLIIVLSKMMDQYGVISKMVENLEKIIGSPKAMLFIIPSILSTFTATGSAIFAAPVINTLGERTGITKARKAAINLYIRHAWYFVLPLSVSLLNAAYVANIPIIELIKVQIPITLACLAAGYFVYIAPIRVEKNELSSGRSKEIALKALLYTSPLLLCVILVIWIPFYTALIVACLITYLIRDNNKKVYDVLIKGQGKGYNLTIAVAGIMIFKDIIHNLPGMQLLMQEIIGLGIPIWLAAVFLAAILAFISGSTQIVVAMLYPLFLPLVPSGEVVAAAMLIYTAGFTTYFISPIHLCQALTNDFFEVSLTELYREYYITVPVMFLSGLVMYFLLTS